MTQTFLDATANPQEECKAALEAAQPKPKEPQSTQPYPRISAFEKWLRQESITRAIAEITRFTAELVTRKEWQEYLPALIQIQADLSQELASLLAPAKKTSLTEAFNLAEHEAAYQEVRAWALARMAHLKRQAKAADSSPQTNPPPPTTRPPCRTISLRS